jgi:hypothetical protein
MGEPFDKFIRLDIPEVMHLTRNIQTTAARAALSGASLDDTARAVLAAIAGNIVEIEERLLALERQVGIELSKPSPVEERIAERISLRPN